MYKKRITSIIVVLLCFSMCIGAYAKDQKSRLKTELESNHLYYSTSINELNQEQINDKKSFKNKYDNQYVVVSGSIADDSIQSKGREVKLYIPSSDDYISVDTSSKDVIKSVEALKGNSTINVYGQLSVKGLKDDSYTIKANKIEPSATINIPNHSYACLDGTIYTGKLVSDLTSDKRVKFYLPDTWNGDYIMNPLTNNGIKGYQYSLNALSPQNLDYPEIFNIFYFNYETFLEKPLVNPTGGDKKNIENKIIENIIPVNTYKITNLRDTMGKKWDYVATTYTPKDGLDYRLEFLFKPDKEGITCMLYLYYPKEDAVRHVEDVFYLIETMEISDES